MSSTVPLLPPMRPRHTTPPTDMRLNITCPAVGFSRSMSAAAMVQNTGIMAIITPENTVPECSMPYCSPKK